MLRFRRARSGKGRANENFENVVDTYCVQSSRSKFAYQLENGACLLCE